MQQQFSRMCILEKKIFSFLVTDLCIRELINIFKVHVRTSLNVVKVHLYAANRIIFF